MIVYNVQRAWFAMKNDAETYRREHKLPPDALATIRVDDREDLASLLNTLCGVGVTAVTVSTNIVRHDGSIVDRLPQDVRDRNMVVPGFVPDFLLKDWTKQKLTRG